MFLKFAVKQISHVVPTGWALSGAAVENVKENQPVWMKAEWAASPHTAETRLLIFDKRH